jgi:1-deoxy-D-xylulose-5-phosphate reductoisomerase
MSRSAGMEGQPRRVTVLGSTGSVGRTTLDLIARAPDTYEIQALTAGRKTDQLAQQARQVRAKLAVVADEARYRALKDALAGSGIEAAAGPAALVEAANRPVDWVMAAIVGAAGLSPTLAAIRQGASVALANKETLVCAGGLVIAEAAAHGARLLPVDSEHNAIFQVLDTSNLASVDRIILTASGGPFWRLSRKAMAAVTPKEAVAHPIWAMGAKISVDSATMMNKGLEIIEAFHLFRVASDRIEVVVHPQSVVHSLVAYVDGSVLAQLGTPDMHTPIAHALAWPKRMSAPVERLDLARLGRLTFEQPDPVRFPALRLARQALQLGGTAPAILNAANEVAVQRFLSGSIGFLAIADIIEETLGAMAVQPLTSLDMVFEVDREARAIAAGIADCADRRAVVAMAASNDTIPNPWM